MSYQATAIGIGISHIFDTMELGGSVPPSRSIILLESVDPSDAILQESGDYILLE